MIHFFRRIRQGLLSQNRFSKYLLYAIGEILLVVIGILIALQVNDWNENRKLKISELTYLNKLEKDILNMLDEYALQRTQFPKFIQNAVNGLKYAESCGQRKELTNDFNYLLLDHQTMQMLPSENNTYQEMLANGLFSKMRNDSLKYAISQVYSGIEFSNSQVTYFRDEIGRASEIINSYVQFSYDKNKQLSVSYTLEAICNSLPFKNALVELVDARMDNLYSVEYIIKTLKKAKKLLDEELRLYTYD